MLKNFRASLQHARRGIRLAVREEPNLRIHALFAGLAVILGSVLRISAGEWSVLLLIIALVICLEMVNSIFERAIDMIKPTVNDYVKDIKDMMAASVLVAAIAAVLIGIVIFLPKIAVYLQF